MTIEIENKMATMKRKLEEREEIIAKMEEQLRNSKKKFITK